MEPEVDEPTESPDTMDNAASAAAFSVPRQNPANDDTDKKEVVETIRSGRSTRSRRAICQLKVRASCTAGPVDDVKRLRKKLPVLQQKVLAAKTIQKTFEFVSNNLLFTKSCLPI